ncbi:MAG TPA: hypothetical protein VLA98_04770, partial [Solirubrobacteraceae bacterium]|nr:hypothetical protein [Solirubrobacteraceae bacterium]
VRVHGEGVVHRVLPLGGGGARVDALVAGGTAWLQAARAVGAVYGGFSAGCAIAPRRALVGGWRAEVGGRRVEVCAEEAGEDLDAVDVRDGLGLLPGAADVHAAQWGTLQRLLHAVVGGAAAVGWAVDEHTVLEVDGGAVRVHGEGVVHRVLPLDRGGARVDALVAGTTTTAEAP